MADKERIVSIIIPVYQAKETLRACVESCVDQADVKRDEIEIILVDDGSTDGSSELCDEIASQYGEDLVKVRHTKNFGVSHARNIGIEMATARFIAFVDSDDLVTKSFVDNCTKYADESTVLIDETHSFQGTQKISGFQYIENSTLNRNTHVWGKLFCRKTIVDNHITFREGLAIGEDLLFMIDFALTQERNHTIRCIADGDYVYTENEHSAMNRAFKESYMDQLICWRDAEDKLKAHATELSPYAFVSIAVSQILTALLVAGKIAVAIKADAIDKTLVPVYMQKVKEQIDHALETRGAFAALSSGHKIKVMIFRISPNLYLKLYGDYKA